MVRNLISVNSFPCKPGRTWRKKTGGPCDRKRARASHRIVYWLMKKGPTPTTGIAEKAKWKLPLLGEPYIASDREVEIRKHNPLWDEVYTVKGSEITFRILLQVIELSLE